MTTEVADFVKSIVTFVRDPEVIVVGIGEPLRTETRKLGNFTVPGKLRIFIETCYRMNP